MNRLESLDREIAERKSVVTSLLAETLELYEHPTYRRLAGKTPDAPMLLTGLTFQSAETAVAAVGYSLILSSNLNSTIDQAAGLHATMPLLFQGERIGEIERLLHGESVRLPSIDTSDAETKKVTVDLAIRTLQTSIGTARETILAVDRAWTSLPVEMEALRVELTQIEKLSGRPGSLDEVKAGARKVLDLLRGDPLGAQSSFRELTLRLAEIRKAADTEYREWHDATDELKSARGLAEELLDLHAQASAANADCFRKVQVDPQGAMPLDEKAIFALVEWLDRLAPSIEKRIDWHPARIGLKHWQKQASAALATDRTALKDAESLLQERLDLRGLLGALQAKAAAFSLAEDAELSHAGSEASKLLYKRPTPMIAARKRVAEFQAILQARLH